MKTHCPSGHAYAGDNIIHETSKGRRSYRCRQCRSLLHERRKATARASLSISESPGGTASAVELVDRIGHRWVGVATRFWAKVDRSAGPDECWPWTGYIFKGGYGRALICRELPRALAHRLAWVLHHGIDPPAGHAICHSCDNPPCCNPAHLWPGTDADNHADMHRKGRRTYGPKEARQATGLAIAGHEADRARA